MWLSRNNEELALDVLVFRIPSWSHDRNLLLFRILAVEDNPEGLKQIPRTALFTVRCSDIIPVRWSYVFLNGFQKGLLHSSFGCT